MRVRKIRQRRGWAFGVGVPIAKSAIFTTTTHTWIDGEKLPETGGCIVVLNHISHTDPLLAAYFVYDHGRLPRYLAKSGLFKNKALGGFLSAAGQIPVERLSRTAVGAYDAAVAAVRDGECVVIYPEGTLTRDPDLWPMTGKSGAARIALETGCPVIPVGQWGAQELLAPYARKPDIFPRKRIVMKAGDPVDLRDLMAKPRTSEVISETTDRIMAAITSLVEELRGEKAPARAFRPPHDGRATDREPQQEGRTLMGKVAVFGAGSWGTAFSIVLADAGNEVTIWGRRDDVCATINDRHENTDYLPGIELPSTVSATHDPERAVDGADIVVFAVPSQTFRENLTGWSDIVPSDAVMVSLMKGVELGTVKRMSEVIAEVTGAGPERIAVVSGPNLSKEIARREPAASVVACADEEVAKMLQVRSHSPAFRPYTSVDVLGCELGGAYKNVVALSVGMAVGLGFGDNTTASVITRGLAETARLAMALGANPMTLMGLAGLGDLVATCSSPLSRNRTFGENLGKGMTTEEIYASTRQVAEGAKSCSSLLELAKREGIDAPIAEHVDAVVDGRMTAQEMMDSFVARDPKAETD